MSAPATAPPVWTIGTLLQWTERFFAGKGVESPRLDAQVLLAHCLGCARAQLYTRYDEQPSEDRRTRFRELVRRRADGAPVAYLVGHKEFYLLRIAVTPDVLIPRPATETLVMAALERLKGMPAPRVLDLCCGGGCVGIAIAKNAPAAAVLATDVSGAAVEVAARNVNELGLAGRVTIATGDLFEAVPPGERFDVIVCNPPYVPSGDVAALAPEVRDHEPQTALDGGPDGLAVIGRVLETAADYLAGGGRLLVEVGAGQADAVSERVAASSGLTFETIVSDRDSVARVVVARRFR